MASIPPNAQRVFSGKVFDVYQWEQPLFDGSTATFEVARRPDSVVVLATAGDRIVMEDEEQPGRTPVVTLPCGEIQASESPRSAAERELLEETGYRSDDWELLASEAIASSKLAWTIHYYLARAARQVKEPTPEPGERIRTRLVDFVDFVATTKRPDFQNQWFSLRFYRMTPADLEQFRARLFTPH
jgi:ADP-ribose pyrophosphatase YjhB (NUDIX family)